jgi:hypothetical protein
MKGKISISRPSGNGPTRIRIEIDDALSGVQFFRGEMTLTNFALALTARGDCPIDFEYRPGALKLIGFKREHKTELVPIPIEPDDWRKRDQFKATAKKAIAAFAVDGWEPRYDDVTNSHNRREGGEANVQLYAIGFTRWIAPKKGKAKP